MLKSILIRILFSKRIAPAALRCVLKAHNFLYDLGGSLAVAVNEGVHPKHHILRYKEWFLDHITPDSVILDIGSNTGAMPALLANKARQVYGIEIDPYLSETAKQIVNIANVEFLTGDATSFDYSGCMPIDCVTLSNVLEHINNRIEFLRMLQSRLPWRQSNQRMFLIRVPALERDWLSVYKKEFGVEYRLDRTHEIEHTKQELLAELDAAGLEVRELDIRFGEYFAVCYGRTS